MIALRDFTCREIWEAAPKEADVDTDPCAHACLPCRIAFGTAQQWGAHAHRSHAYKSASTVHALGRRCTACGTAFAHNGKLRKHLQYSKACLHLCSTGQVSYEPLHDAGHEQGPSVRASGQSVRIDIPDPVFQPLLQSLQDSRPDEVSQILDMVCGFGAPFDMLKHTLEVWLCQHLGTFTPDFVSAVLAKMEPRAMGCRFKDLHVSYPDFKFQPLLRPFPTAAAECSSLCCCGGSPPLAWLQLFALDVDGYSQFSFWDRVSIDENAALFIRIPEAPAPCTNYWTLEPMTLRRARTFLKWSSQLQWLLAASVKHAYCGFPVLLDAGRCTFSQLEPLSSWCTACGATTSEAFSVQGLFHIRIHSP